ncbi:hypothetical protein DESUT3_07010 [Desulfuromonas versatilis]|uniref:DUF2339 domain-containing protein n=1 Tax=Desulfuromonas versatilis TaxID=2802975 RepID=A0ABN6DU38_9BACT|nr:DUF2339 domain-containing protein [Desulfuromonas versatilis]BCR03632.1 hypothetical protein DESUT3_07010 [Desulfuromonas versatilis]
MSDLDKRLEALEARLERLEKLLAGGAPPRPVAPPAEEDPGFVFEPLDEPPLAGRRRPHPPKRTTIPPRAPRARPSRQLSVTNILGWGGVAALVLAAAYLVKLGIDLGWLSPARQIGLTVLGALGLIGTGIALRRADRGYASLLPAGGVVILFLATYGAHLYYRLIPVPLAAGAIILVCLGSLWLCRFFESELYALFAVAGSYSAPLLLAGLRGSILDLAIYFSAWALVFSIYAVWVGRRLVYLVALYLGLIIFDLVWRFDWAATARHHWVEAFGFQCVQFVIFAGATTAFSIRRASPLDRNTALAHLPALLIFYVLQYTLLDRFLPAWAPWIAVASAAVLALAYWGVRRSLGGESSGGRLLLSSYVALVMLHAGYLQSVPLRWQPWVGLVLAAVVAGHTLARGGRYALGWPILGAVGLIYASNLMRVVLLADLARVPGSGLLVIAYAAELYGGFWLVRRARLNERWAIALVYGGHVCAMAAAVHLFANQLAVSLCWGLLALACLFLALARRDKILGQSSLLVFAASAAKVLLYDLAGAPPLVRIACLLVLGVSFYLGGWLYKRVSALEEKPG